MRMGTFPTLFGPFRFIACFCVTKNQMISSGSLHLGKAGIAIDEERQQDEHRPDQE